MNLKEFYWTLITYVPLSWSMLSNRKKKIWKFLKWKKTELNQLTCSYTLYQGHRKQAFPIRLYLVHHSPNLCLSTWNQIYQNQMEAWKGLIWTYISSKAMRQAIFITSEVSINRANESSFKLTSYDPVPWMIPLSKLQDRKPFTSRLFTWFLEFIQTYAFKNQSKRVGILKMKSKYIIKVRFTEREGGRGRDSYWNLTENRILVEASLQFSPKSWKKKYWIDR